MAITCNYCKLPITDSTAMYDLETNTYLHTRGNSAEQIIGTAVSKGVTPLNCVTSHIKKMTLEGKAICLSPVDIS